MFMTIKCENCGGNLQQDSEKPVAFCPYCGVAVKQPEDLVDLAKFTMKHEEEVRQRQVQESKEKEKRDNKIGFIWFGLLFAICAILTIIMLVPRNNQKKSAEETTKKVQQLILEQKYDEALLEAQNIRITKDGLFDDEYYRWENQRKELIKIIEQKQKETQ